MRRVLERVRAQLRFGVVAVAGDSMRPVLRPGDLLLVRYGVPVRLDDVVVARLPGRGLGVKRAVLHDDDGWWLASEDPLNGTDSSTFGSVPDADVLGRVVARYWPRPARIGPFPARRRA